MLAAAGAPAVMAAAAPVGVAGAVSEPCPLATLRHAARLVSPAMSETGDAAAVRAGVDAPLPVVVALEGPSLPSGVFPVVNIDTAPGPEGGRVSTVTGYPESLVRFSAPGQYELALTVTLVARSSCGGVRTRTVLARRIPVEVAP